MDLEIRAKRLAQPLKPVSCSDATHAPKWPLVTLLLGLPREGIQGLHLTLGSDRNTGATGLLPTPSSRCKVAIREEADE